MMLFRRLPGLIYTHRYILYFILAAGSILVIFLFKWNLLCTNLQAWKHVSEMCKLYDDQIATGSLCAPMCSTKDIHSLICHSFPSSKEAVFSAQWRNKRLVFKTTSYNHEKYHSVHWFNNGIKQYPTEKEFVSAIRRIIKTKLNLTLAHDSVARLSRLSPGFEDKKIDNRRREMDNIWMLMQDNEFLLSKIFSEKDVFPQLLGTCGPYFAVEYLQPIQEVSSYLSFRDSKDEWGKRLKTSIQILELLEELEEDFKEPIHLCDIKLEHFGVVLLTNKVKFIDLNGVYPRSVINHMITDASNTCQKDDDCDFYDCRSKCLAHSKTCSSVRNNNLQIVCEKIFLGWRLSNTVIVPGLLLSQHTPSELASLLRQCANPENESGKPRASPESDLKKRLINVLSEVEQSVNNNDFL